MKTQLLNLILLGIVSTLPAFIHAQAETKHESDSIVFVDQVNSLDALFAKYKGQLNYVDFWASWCKPCVEEFMHHSQIDSFMHANSIIRLYIALEKMETDSVSQQKSVAKWKETVLKHNLVGQNYYVRLKSEFFKGITEKIMKGKLSLPRFAIVDANGNIVERDATNPSKPEKLINQLRKYLK